MKTIKYGEGTMAEDEAVSEYGVSPGFEGVEPVGIRILDHQRHFLYRHSDIVAVWND